MSRLLSAPLFTWSGFLAKFLAFCASLVLTPSRSVVFFSLASALFSMNIALSGIFFRRVSGMSFSWGSSLHSSRPPSSASESCSPGSARAEIDLPSPLKLLACRPLTLDERRPASAMDLARLVLDITAGPPRGGMRLNCGNMLTTFSLVSEKLYKISNFLYLFLMLIQAFDNSIKQCFALLTFLFCVQKVAI